MIAGLGKVCKTVSDILGIVITIICRYQILLCFAYMYRACVKQKGIFKQVGHSSNISAHPGSLNTALSIQKKCFIP